MGGIDAVHDGAHKLSHQVFISVHLRTSCERKPFSFVLPAGGAEYGGIDAVSRWRP